MKQFKGQPPVSTVMFVLCCMVCLAIQVFNISSQSETAILLGAYYKPFIIAGEFWRLLSVGFVHISIWHLFMNMMALLNLGRFMEKTVGSWRYALILLLSVVGGSAFYFITSRNTFAVGLSGGLYGLMAGYTLLIWYSGTWKNPAVMSALIRTYMINIMINFIPGIAVGAHIGGFFTGLLMTGMLLPLKDKRAKYHYALALVLLCGAMAWLMPKNTYIEAERVYALSDIRILRFEKEHGLEKHAAQMAANLDTIYTDSYYIYERVMED